MSSDFGGSQQYKYQGQAALSNGRATQAAYEKKARALEAEAVSDSHLAARNMKRMRQNQNAAMGSVRAQRGGSGFTSEGSGSQAEVAVADVWESAIGDAALSNAVSDANKRFAAESARYQGDLSMMAARSEADQYKMLSQNALGSAMIQTALTVAGGGHGGGRNVRWRVAGGCYRERADVGFRRRRNPGGFFRDDECLFPFRFPGGDGAGEHAVFQQVEGFPAG